MSFEFLNDYGIIPKYDEPLADHTTFCLGGPCKTFIHCQSPHQLQNIIERLVHFKMEFILIGEGSNILVSDDGVDCVVICYYSDVPQITHTDNIITVSGSSRFDDLAYYAAENELGGLSFANGIPGTVGGAIVGNAGAFGKQIGDILESISIVNHSGECYTLKPEDCDFYYRHSRLKDTREYVLEANIKVINEASQVLFREREEILALRRSKHPNIKENPCAGSFFRNVEPTSEGKKRVAAGWFLDQAGAKDLYAGGAKIYEKHANIIVKGKHCLAQDVFNLSVKMSEVVKAQFDIDLVREVRCVGSFDGLDDVSGGNIR